MSLSSIICHDFSSPNIKYSIIIIIFSHLSFSFIICSYVIVYDNLERSIFTYHHFYHHSLSLSLTNYHPPVSIFHCLSSSTVSPPVTYQHSSYFLRSICVTYHIFSSQPINMCHYLSLSIITFVCLPSPVCMCHIMKSIIFRH